MTHWPGGVFTVAVKQTYLWLTSHEAHINNSSGGENNDLSVTHTYTESAGEPGGAGLGWAKEGKGTTQNSRSISAMEMAEVECVPLQNSCQDFKLLFFILMSSGEK